ncbi:hypothetical protein I6F30_09945 [Bradyrhizobium sp. NBAIM20]|uniref:hypothetical protein n=1 Tax=unclassified Bradyrhizobium TaxID=2631580 RepID=UPI001CD3D97A|nr:MULTISPECIES: hypothetical protein [unclassified Bradyrhizobium]MCA1411469.1 hypothetical protein [Bradyrhizobium sp. NBAIM20]MCA1460669.1 hypothetical protein [Bradyrhizobium sp. NBAIM18]
MRRVILTVQEIEFAFACRTFVLEMDPRAGNQIIIEGDALAVPNSGKTRRAFLNYGLARLLRVFNRAIEQRAIPLEQVPGLLSNLALFSEKVLNAFEAFPEH